MLLNIIWGKTMMYICLLSFAQGRTKAVSDQAKEFKAPILRDQNTPTDPPWMSRPGMLIISIFNLTFYQRYQIKDFLNKSTYCWHVLILLRRSPGVTILHSLRWTLP